MGRAADTIIKWEWLILLILFPFLLFPSGRTSLLLLVIPLLWLLRKFATGQFFPDTPLDISIFVLLVALLISLAAVFNMEQSFPKIAGLIFGIAVFYAGVAYTRRVEMGQYHLLVVIIAAGSGMAFIGLLSNGKSSTFALFSPIFNLVPIPVTDILGSAANPNEIAGVLGWLLPLLTAITFGYWRDLWKSRRWSAKILLLILLVLVAFNGLILLLTRSRGAVFSVGFAILLMLAIRYRWGRWLLVLLTVGVILFAIFFNSTNILFGDQSAVSIDLQARLEIWSRALYALADFPLTGMGMNGFRQLVHVLYPLFSVSPTFDVGHAHNQLLQAGLDLGFMGLISYLSIWLLCAAVLWLGWRMINIHTDRVLLIGISGALASGWLFGIVDAIALGARPGFLWWLILGLLVANSDSIRKNKILIS